MNSPYRREEAFVLHLLDRLKLQLAEPPQNPNSNKFQSGADVSILLASGRRIGIQVTEIDPFPESGVRGRERAQKLASASDVYGNYVQNNAEVILRAISRSIARKTLITFARKQFDETWLLLCCGVPDAPTSTLIPTALLSASDLDEKTVQQLLNSHYAECFLLPFVGTERALYRWSRNGTARWKKKVRLEEIARGAAGDAEYVRALLRTGGNDRSVVDAQVRRVIDEIRSNGPPGATRNHTLGIVQEWHQRWR